MLLAGFLPPWDIERRKGDATRLARWALNELLARGVRVERLEELHHVIDREAAPDLARHLTAASRRAEPRAALHALVREVLPSLPWDMLAIQAAIHFRILVPGDALSPVPAHSDFGIGHALDERNLWIALTPARRSAALHLASLADSIEIDRRRREAKRLFADDVIAPEALEAYDAEAGDVLLFTPLHVHGARIVEEATTRVSVDVRIAPRATACTRNPFGYVEVS